MNTSRTNRGNKASGHISSGEFSEGAGMKTGPAIKRAGKQIKEGATEAVDQVREQAKTAAQRQKDAASRKVETIAKAIRQTADGLSEDEQLAPLGGYVREAAERVESFSEYLREHDVRDLFNGIERWARRNPALFLGGAFVGGLLLARFLKSTHERRSNEEFGQNHDDEYEASGGINRFGRRESESVRTAASQYGGRFSQSATPPGMSEPGVNLGQTSPGAGSWEQT